MLLNKKIQKGFTLIELLVVIAIIGILSALSIVALGNARAKSRDAKRVADIKQISTALDLYYSDYGYYPTLITPGSPLTSADGTKTYIDKIPNNPSPRNDNGCGNNNYTYASTSDNTNYSLNFCLGDNAGASAAGVNSVSGGGLTVPSGLVGWWKFDEGAGTTVADSSGNGSTGTLVSGPSWQAASDCKNRGCIKFNGAGDYVNIPYNSVFNTPSGTTISFWAKYAQTTGNRQIIARGGVFFIRGLEGGSSVNVPYVYAAFLRGYSGCSYTDNVWYHFVQVYDPSNAPTLRSYKNGVLSSSDNALSGSMATNTNGISIGGDSGSWVLYVDDVRLYNRVLSASEISALYNSLK